MISAGIVRGLNSQQRVAQKTGEARGFIYQISPSGLDDVAPQIKRDAEMREKSGVGDQALANC